MLLALFFLFLPLVALAESAEPAHRLDHSVMHQAQLIVPTDKPTPQIGLLLVRDLEDGFNLRVELRNFRIESPSFSTETQEGIVSGHAHLYLNGVKLTRLYTRDLHLPARLFREGMNSLQVSINDHNHAVWAIEKEPIQATVLMNPARDTFQMSHYSSSPISR